MVTSNDRTDERAETSGGLLQWEGNLRDFQRREVHSGVARTTTARNRNSELIEGGCRVVVY